MSEFWGESVFVCLTFRAVYCVYSSFVISYSCTSVYRLCEDEESTLVGHCLLQDFRRRVGVRNSG